MKPPDEGWVRRMAELEDGLPVSAGGLPFRQVEPPSPEDPEVRRLQAMAELEDGLPVSAGGLPFRQLAPTGGQPHALGVEERSTDPEKQGPSGAA
jgi:hypothetical protein